MRRVLYTVIGLTIASLICGDYGYAQAQGTFRSPNRNAQMAAPSGIPKEIHASGQSAAPTADIEAATRRGVEQVERSVASIDSRIGQANLIVAVFGVIVAFAILIVGFAGFLGYREIKDVVRQANEAVATAKQASAEAVEEVAKIRRAGRDAEFDRCWTGAYAYRWQLNDFRTAFGLVARACELADDPDTTPKDRATLVNLHNFATSIADYLGEFRQGIAWSDRALKEDPEDVTANYHRGLNTFHLATQQSDYCSRAEGIKDALGFFYKANELHHKTVHRFTPEDFVKFNSVVVQAHAELVEIPKLDKDEVETMARAGLGFFETCLDEGTKALALPDTRPRFIRIWVDAAAQAASRLESAAKMRGLKMPKPRNVPPDLRLEKGEA